MKNILRFFYVIKNKNVFHPTPQHKLATFSQHCLFNARIQLSGFEVYIWLVDNKKNCKNAAGIFAMFLCMLFARLSVIYPNVTNRKRLKIVIISGNIYFNQHFCTYWSCI
jgi:hypothetical protein